MMARWILFMAAALFAVPAHAKPDEGGAQLGVYLQEMNEELRVEHDFDGEGVLVTGLVEGSGAAKVGLQKGDIILFFNNTGVESTQDLVRAIARTSPGDKIPVVVLSGGKGQVRKPIRPPKKVNSLVAPSSLTGTRFGCSPESSQNIEVRGISSS